MKKQRPSLSPWSILHQVLRDMEIHRKTHQEQKARFLEEWEKWGIRPKGRS